MRHRRKILKPRTPNAPQAKILRSRDFLNPARSAAKIFSDFTGENYMLNKNHNIFEAQNAKKIKPRFRNAPQAKNFETPRKKNAPQAKIFETPCAKMRHRRNFLKSRTPNALQAKKGDPAIFKNPARSAAKIFCVFTGENDILNKNCNFL